MDWWEKLAEDNPKLVKYTESIGKSFEGRDQPAVHITASENLDVKQIYFQCQIHASKQMGGAASMKFLTTVLNRRMDLRGYLYVCG